MNFLKSTTARILGFVFVGATIGLSALILSTQVPGGMEAIEQIRCVIGIPADGSTCVADKIAALNDQRRTLEDEQERLADVIAAQDFVFTQGDQLKDGINLVVGTLYQDAVSQQGLLRSFCWAVVDDGGLDPRVGLSVMHSDGRITDVSVGAAELALLEMGANDVDSARALCPFPRG